MVLKIEFNIVTQYNITSHLNSTQLSSMNKQFCDACEAGNLEELKKIINNYDDISEVFVNGLRAAMVYEKYNVIDYLITAINNKPELLYNVIDEIFEIGSADICNGLAYFSIKSYTEYNMSLAYIIKYGRPDEKNLSNIKQLYKLEELPYDNTEEICQYMADDKTGNCLKNLVFYVNNDILSNDKFDVDDYDIFFRYKTIYHIDMDCIIKLFENCYDYTNLRYGDYKVLLDRGLPDKYLVGIDLASDFYNEIKNRRQIVTKSLDNYLIPDIVNLVNLFVTL
jgi:hypothetical protein